MSGDTQRAILAELAAGMQEITRLVGLDPESGEIEPTVERVRTLAAATPAPLTEDQRWQWRASMIADLSGMDGVWDDVIGDLPDARSYFETIADGLLKAGWRFAGVPAAPADDEATPTMRTLHVTTTRDIPEGHTDQRVHYEWEGDSWEAWFIAFGKGENGQEAYLMRDNGERWVVMADNITEIDSAAALAALREEQR